MTTVISQFKAFLQHVGYSESTRNMLPACVSEFLEHQHITDIGYVEQQQVKQFYGYLQERPLKKRKGMLSEMMISHYVYALKTFFAWAQATGQASYNPVSGMKFRRPKQNVREPLSTEEVSQLFAAAATLKEKAMLHVFYSCGLRRSEGEMLNIQDIHFSAQLLYVRQGKGARRRVIPVTARVVAELQQYCQAERCSSVARTLKDQDAFMLNRAGHRMKGDQYNRLLKSILERSGIDKDITLHHLRHSIATHLLQGGMSMEYVRDFLGHSHLETTQIYAKTDQQKLSSL